MLALLTSRNKDFFTTDLRHPYNKAGDGPEGPEVRTTADKLSVLAGYYLTNYQTDNQIKGDDSLLKNQSTLLLRRVGCYGKKILLFLTNQQGQQLTLVVSLGMTGRFYFYQTEILANTHALLTFQSVVKDQENQDPTQPVTTAKTVVVGYQDPRKLGSFQVIYTDQLNDFLSDLGPDLLESALTTEISEARWLEIFSKPMRSSCAIANVLVDQKYLAGIGWYLAMEMLYFAGISPHRPAKDLTLQDWLNLRKIAHQVIKISYSYGGLTIRDYISPDGQSGNYPASVYGRKVDPNGYRVINGKCGGRSTHYVAELQK